MSRQAAPGLRSPFRRVAVVGCGLIGGSFALASQEAAGVAEVAVWDLDPDVRARARRRGVEGTVETVRQAVAGADVVLLGVPVPRIAEAAAGVVDHLDPAAVLTDVGSVKAGPVREVERLLAAAPSGVAFVGGHPMAGREHPGVDAADATLFQGAPWVLTPTATSDLTAFDRLGAHLRAIGARVLAVDPDVHDRLVAVASHLPQALATTLMGLAADVAVTTGEGVLAVAGGGFRDVTRIAASDPGLWVDILIENREAVAEALGRFDLRLRQVHEALERADAPTLHRLLAEGRDARTRLPSKAVVGPLIDLVVPLDDRPGVLAQVTTALGEAGVNIEDLNMRHASDGSRGSLLVAVAGADTATRARALLAGRGFPSHFEPRSEA